MSSDSDNVSSEDDFQNHLHLFKSSLDIGSHFIDIEPANELVFNNMQGTLFSQLTIKNVTSKAYVAYFVIILRNFYLTMLYIGLYLKSFPNHYHAKARLYPTLILASYQHWLAR
jgi:hypothetical protein